MTTVDRMYTEIDANTGDPVGDPKPLSWFSSKHAVVLLGDPGMGKSTTFEKAASDDPIGTFVPIGEFLVHPVSKWRGKTLFLDGLDEQRTTLPDGRSVLDRICGNIEELGRPLFRISCRVADWHGSIDVAILRRVSGDDSVTLLRIEPLTDADVLAIAKDVVPDPDDFVEQAERRGITDLLRNPHMLRMLLRVFKEKGAWPSTKIDLFQLTCEILVVERNPVLRRYPVVRVDKDKLLDGAGYICGVILCGLGDGAVGVALDPGRADQRFPDIESLRHDLKVLNAVVRRNLFQGAGTDRVVTVHRTIAEYLAALHFSRLLRENILPIRRLLALLTGRDGGTVSELRGIYAWLATLCPEHADLLIPVDPFGVVLYGDIAGFTPQMKALIIRHLRTLADRNPYFRSENWVWRPFASLVAPELESTFRDILEDPSQQQVFVSCILDAIGNGEPLPGLGENLRKFVYDETRPYYLRVDALDAFAHVCPDKSDAFTSLLEDIHTGKVKDEDYRLRGILLKALYPAVIKPTDIIKYLVGDAMHTMGEYGRFVDYELLDMTPEGDLPALLDVISTSGLPCLSEDRFTGRQLVGKLLMKTIPVIGDHIYVERLYRWLGVALDEYDTSIIEKEEAQKIREWLEARPSVILSLYEHWLGSASPEKIRSEEHRLLRRLHLARIPSSLAFRMLDWSVNQPDDRIADFLFRSAVSFRLWDNRPDAPTIEDLEAFVFKHPRFQAAYALECSCDLSEWRLEAALREKKQRARKEKTRRENRKVFTKHIGEIRGGHPTGRLLHLAKLYFGLFSDVDREAAPWDRLVKEVGEKVAAAALEGFVAALERAEIPSPDMIGDAYTRQSVFPLGYIVLAGLDIMAARSEDQLMTLTDATLEPALAFHHVMLAGDKRAWVDRVYRDRPEVAARALEKYYRPCIQKGLSHIPGFEGLFFNKGMAEVSRILAVPLLQEFPSPAVETLKILLQAAMRHGKRDEFIRVAENALRTIRDEASGLLKLLWAAAAYLVQPDKFATTLSRVVGRDDKRALTVIDFFRPFIGEEGKLTITLSPSALGKLTAILGRALGLAIEPSSRREGRLLRSEVEELRDLILLIAEDTTKESTTVLASLKRNPDLKVLRGYILKAIDTQATKSRETEFRYLGVKQVVGTLDGGSPANAADLQALVSEHLRSIGDEIDRGSTDAYRAFWNYPRNMTPTPKLEEECRDRVLEWLRPKLRPQRVTVEREGSYAGGTSGDIKAIFGDVNIPVEAKRHFHRELWTAPTEQLKKLYMQDPGTKGRGIYLVLWYGVAKGRTIPPHPKGIPRPKTPSQLAVCLQRILSERDRAMIEIVVIDVSKGANAATKRPKVQKRPGERRRGSGKSSKNTNGRR